MDKARTVAQVNPECGAHHNITESVEVQANAQLIINAVNNTAGAGIDPNAVPGLLEIAKGLNKVMNAGLDIKAGLSLHDELKAAIKSAEIKS